MDTHIQLIKDFVGFAKEIDNSKSIKNFHRLVVTPDTLNQDTVTKLLEQARKCFTNVDFFEVKSTED